MRPWRHSRLRKGAVLSDHRRIEVMIPPSINLE